MKLISSSILSILIAASTGSLNGQATPVISLYSEEESIIENSKTYLSIQVQPDVILTDSIEVKISVSGTATQGGDFLSLPSTFFTATDKITIIPIVPIDNNHSDGHKTITVEILAGNGYTVGPNNSVTLNLVDDDSLTYGTVIRIGTSRPASYTYHWQFVDYGCGGDHSTWSNWSDWDGSCADDNKESRTRTCNNEASGTSQRTIWCQRSDGLNMGDVSDVYVGCETSNRPEDTPACSRGCIGENTEDRDCYTYSWHTGGWSGCQGNYDDWSGWSGWSGCSASCGWGSKTRTRYCFNNNRGYQTRTVYCRRSDGTSVSDSYCSGSKPNSNQSCSRGCSGSGSESQSCRQKPCCRNWVGNTHRCHPYWGYSQYYYWVSKSWCQSKCEDLHAKCCMWNDGSTNNRGRTDCTATVSGNPYIISSTDWGKQATMCE